MNTFETIIIFSMKPDLETVHKAIEKFHKIIQSYSNVKKVKIDDMGEKKLAYELKGNKTGYYVVFYYQADPTNITGLERRLRIDDNVLKFMTVKINDLEGDEYELEDYHPEDEKSEQKEEKPDALDVLLGFADYNKRKEVS